MNYSMRKISAAAVLGITMFASSAVSAKDSIDGSKDLLCAAFSVMACVDGGHCVRGEASTFDLPPFMRVLSKEKVVRATYEGGEKTFDSPIKNSVKSGNQFILQGVENNHGWTMAIHRETGTMKVSSIGHEVSFTAFGACQAL